MKIEIWAFGQRALIFFWFNKYNQRDQQLSQLLCELGFEAANINEYQFFNHTLPRTAFPKMHFLEKSWSTGFSDV